jgi:hypothetical protein
MSDQETVSQPTGRPTADNSFREPLAEVGKAIREYVDNRQARRGITPTQDREKAA